MPALIPVFRDVAKIYFGVEPMLVGSGLRTGLRITYDSPREVGADRVVDAVAALAFYGPPPLIVVDFGTATVFDAIDRDGNYLGGAIAPGIGVAAAALNYFNKSLNKLTVSEAAFLAGLPKAPNNYHPIKEYKAAKMRRNYVISRMFANDYITSSEAINAKREPLVVRRRSEALNTEARALAGAGCMYIQVDEPVFARMPNEALAYGFEDIERTFYGLPSEVTRVVHMCCGYPNSLDSEGYKKADKNCYLQIADAIEDSSVEEVSFEDAHRHNELSLLEKFSKTRVILGVVEIARSRLESIEEVRDRLTAALEHIDKERLIVAPDCGLGFFNREQAIAKMEVISEAARSL